MKKMTIIISGIVSTAIVFSGCGNSAVQCDSSDAKDLVMQIAAKDYHDTIAPMKMINPSYGEEMDKQWEEQNPKLINIRTDSKDDEIQKTECSAQISFDNGNVKDITYTLSKTSEGQLFAEVMGL